MCDSIVCKKKKKEKKNIKKKLKKYIYRLPNVVIVKKEIFLYFF